MGTLSYRYRWNRTEEIVEKNLSVIYIILKAAVGFILAPFYQPELHKVIYTAGLVENNKQLLVKRNFHQRMNVSGAICFSH